MPYYRTLKKVLTPTIFNFKIVACFFFKSYKISILSPKKVLTTPPTIPFTGDVRTFSKIAIFKAHKIGILNLDKT